MARLVTLITILAILGAFFYRSISPHNKADIQLPDLHGSASIYYDDHGIPHIKASNKISGAFGLGYVHAVDRLWQLHLNRMISQGRLSEMFGELPIQFDQSLRLLNTRNVCEVIISNWPKDISDYLQAYADGINEYVKRNPLPLQFHLIWTDFHPWTPVDSCTYLKLMHFNLNLNWSYEWLRDYLLAASEDEELVNMILPYLPEQSDDVAYSINEEELKEMGWYKKKDHTKVNPRKANPSSYDFSEYEGVDKLGLRSQENQGN